jgi:hypothetical protein
VLLKDLFKGFPKKIFPTFSEKGLKGKTWSPKYPPGNPPSREAAQKS